MTARALLILLVAAVTGLVLAGAGSSAPAQPCKGSQLEGTFAAVPGSAGAGNVVYALRIIRRSGPPCFVSGLPGLRLLDRNRRPLPTHVTPVFRPGLTAVKVTVWPFHGARATARFSPDVPGVGEPVIGRACEPKAYWVRVTPTPGTGTFVAPVGPTTPVCEHGGMQVSAFSPT